MKKYYVIYIIGLNGYLRPMSQKIQDISSNISAAGTWETEELALEWADIIDGINGYFFEIKPVYVKR